MNKAKYCKVVFTETNERYYQGHPERYYSLRIMKYGELITIPVGWESEGYSQASIFKSKKRIVQQYFKDKHDKRLHIDSTQSDLNTNNNQSKGLPTMRISYPWSEVINNTCGDNIELKNEIIRVSEQLNANTIHPTHAINFIQKISDMYPDLSQGNLAKLLNTTPQKISVIKKITKLPKSILDKAEQTDKLTIGAMYSLTFIADKNKETEFNKRFSQTGKVNINNETKQMPENTMQSKTPSIDTAVIISTPDEKQEETTNAQDIQNNTVTPPKTIITRCIINNPSPVTLKNTLLLPAVMELLDILNKDPKIPLASAKFTLAKLTELSNKLQEIITE